MTFFEKVVKVIEGISGYVKRHELLVMIVLGLVLAYWGYGKWVDHEENVSKRAAVTSAQVEAQRKQQDADNAVRDAKNAQATADAFKQYQATVTTLTAQQQASQAMIASLVGQLKKQQVSNDNLDPTGMANRYAVLENLPLSNFTPNSPNLLLSNQAAHQVLNDLETIPVAKQQLAEKDKQLGAKDSLIQAQSVVIVTQGTQITDLQKTVKDKQATIDAADDNTKKQVKAQKDTDRAKINKALKVGAVVGSIAVLVIEHVLLNGRVKK